VRRNTHSPSSGGTFLIHAPHSDAVYLRIEAKGRLIRRAVKRVEALPQLVSRGSMVGQAAWHGRSSPPAAAAQARTSCSGFSRA
jgi:hypothetical protein